MTWFGWVASLGGILSVLCVCGDLGVFLATMKGELER